MVQFYREVIQPEFAALRSEMASKADLQALRNEMATKADLQTLRNEMATKADLQALRNEMATKPDLQALREEMLTNLQEMRSEMVTWPVLMRYHQEIVRPEIDELRSKLAALATRDELLSHVDGIYVRFGRLESEYAALIAAVRRLEQQMSQQNAGLGAVRAELVEVRNEISQLAQRVTNLENVLN
jgi:chromosome segregation ATPase